MTDAKLKAIATFLYRHDMLCRSSARLCLDLVDEEPPAVADLKRTGCTIADIRLLEGGKDGIPCFCNGRPEKRPRHLADIERSRFDVYPD